MATPLQACLTGAYTTIKSRHPGEGRRRWKLGVAAEFWSLSPDQKHQLLMNAPASPDTTNAEWATDADPFDEMSNSRSELGLVVRTDFSDEVAWSAFVEKLQQAEKDFAASADEPEQGMAEDSPEGNAPDPHADAEDSSDEESDDGPIFHIINPLEPEMQALFTNLSNLTALRLFTDIDIRRAPALPAGIKRALPNRLVDRDGWQEIYTGKNIWIYDSKSNTDQCVRLVSHTGDMYGTATGDSWRARVSHICELQANLFTGAMKIDFGGLDRWDYSERQRNMREAEGN
ncbi:hypothetical protein BJ138DRAFT_1154025 [Hygrophoropsis aurantiaca]|uniref:Uncharacterized protein n=1 Tax=Hygrophoropsis aurantiaca TaxID=72124 RepID=A0ACB8AA67_9AGAM|nr:hypothetical protein BJ138DRAFT_1154025 [Hygrophoropsis aurantiaca]